MSLEVLDIEKLEVQYEQHHKKTSFLLIRKQRHRSAAP